MLVGLLVFWVISAASAACPGDRTVGAGTTWDFDTPTLSDLCGGGGTIQLLSTTTNALFEENPGPPTLQDSYLVTRIWQITDYCANTFTCTQRVAW